MSNKFIEHQKNAQINKVKRWIRTAGKQFEFKRPVLNEFNEPNGSETVTKIDGIFHETSSHVSRNSTEGTVTRSRSSPMILLLYEDAKNIHIDDYVLYNRKQYRVSEVKNIAEGDFAVDVSLEEVLGDGKRFSS